MRYQDVFRAAHAAYKAGDIRAVNGEMIVRGLSVYGALGNRVRSANPVTIACQRARVPRRRAKRWAKRAMLACPGVYLKRCHLFLRGMS